MFKKNKYPGSSINHVEGIEFMKIAIVKTENWISILAHALAVWNEINSCKYLVKAETGQLLKQNWYSVIKYKFLYVFKYNEYSGSFINHVEWNEFMQNIHI